MVLSKLETGTRVGDQAFEAVHAAIVNGEYPAGRRLQIRELAAELGISVMPVREAIKRLEEAGLVETKPYRGAVVKDFTPEELLHVYEVRRLLEVAAAGNGTARVGPEDVERLRELYEAVREALERGGVIEYLDRDEEILSVIYAASGNPVMLETIRSLWGRCRHYKIVGVRDELATGDASHLLEYQGRLLSAVTAGDAQGAARVVAESLDASTSRIRQALPEPAAHEVS
jgi:DNA-binding GntR family transcriptional regulator